jgi:hypothetical protein
VALTKCALRTGGLAVAIGLGMTLAPGVAFAEPDGAGSSASSDSSSATGGAKSSSDSQPGAGGSNGSDGPNSAPNSPSAQDNSSERISRLAGTLAQIDRDETEVAKRRVAVDQDPATLSKNVELVDREADVLTRQSVLASRAVQQFMSGMNGIVQGSGAVSDQLQAFQAESRLNLDEMDALIDSQRFEAMDAEARQALADMQAARDTMKLTSSEMDDFIAQIAEQEAYMGGIARNGG